MPLEQFTDQRVPVARCRECGPARERRLAVQLCQRLQALAQGDLSERARRRALEIAEDADLRSKVPSQWMSRDPRPVRRGRKDWRVPVPGTILTRSHKGRNVVVKVLSTGFEYEGQRYRSLSAIARLVTGVRWNGLRFFGLTQRTKGNRRAGK